MRNSPKNYMIPKETGMESPAVRHPQSNNIQVYICFFPMRMNASTIQAYFLGQYDEVA